ncbi:MAG: helix-turn-helix transcriptional regulator [Rhodospirillales bacterium]|nr:helix-turn-helix transcriptional regulator [Rhodospirillales bacterium]
MNGEVFVAQRKPSQLDELIGYNIRVRRALYGLSLDNLARRLNITYQQLHKYETGKNRISASRLYEISKILEVEISYFFEEAEGVEVYLI